MNLDGLCRVLSKWLGTEVTVGPKRGAKAAHTRPPLPKPDQQFVATLTVSSSNAPGKPSIHQTYVQAANELETRITTHNESIVGIRLESFKGADEDPCAALSTFRAKMGLPEFKDDLREEGFGLMDVGHISKINNQAAIVGFVEFKVSYAEIIDAQPAGWIETVQVTPVIDGTPDDPFNVP